MPHPSNSYSFHRRSPRRHLHVALQAQFHIHLRIMETLRSGCVGAEKRVIKLHELRVFERSRSVRPYLHQFTNRRSLLHRAVFGRRKYNVEDPRAVKLH